MANTDLGTLRRRLERTPRGRVLPLLIALASITGCGSFMDDLLEVELSGQVTEAAAESPGQAVALVEGGLTLFNKALNAHIIEGASFGDELQNGPSNAAYRRITLPLAPAF